MLQTLFLPSLNICCLDALHSGEEQNGSVRAPAAEVNARSAAGGCAGLCRAPPGAPPCTGLSWGRSPPGPPLGPPRAHGLVLEAKLRCELLGISPNLSAFRVAGCDPWGAVVMVRFISIVLTVFNCVMDKLDHTAVTLSCTASQMCSARDGPCLN